MISNLNLECETCGHVYRDVPVKDGDKGRCTQPAPHNAGDPEGAPGNGVCGGELVTLWDDGGPGWRMR